MPPEEAEAAVALLLELVPAGHEVTPTGLAVYVEAQQLAGVRAAFPTLTVEQVDPGWEDAWRRFHTGVRIGPLWVGPPWERAPAEALAIVIEPGRAFGTGSHPTTRLALELLVELEPGSLLDIGCGSGVIAIAAAKLGFAPVRAGDTDPVAVEVTRENAERNGVAVEAAVLDARTGALEAEVVVANIALDVVEALAPRVHCRHLVLSGYLAGDRPAVTGLAHVARRERDGWAADSYRPE